MRGLLFLVALGFGLAAADDGINAWLRYDRLPKDVAQHAAVPSVIVALNSTASSPVYTAGHELQKGIEGILGTRLSVAHTGHGRTKKQSTITIGTVDAFTAAGGKVHIPEQLEDDGYWLSTRGDSVQILGQNERGALYGAFEYLSRLARGDFSEVATANNPRSTVRWVNQWDNLDGTIERGYAGLSLFFANGSVLANLTRVNQYGRLLASVGVNGLVVNNVNADANLLTDANMAGLGRIADELRPWGVRVGISLNFASPQLIGNLSSYDPLDPTVMAWWANQTDKLYAHVPDLAGYLVKANSEGQPGPLTYNRTLADGANLFAAPLKPHGGILMFRAFVYDSTGLNESVWTDDRANAAVDFFRGLDGAFDDNVVVQIKYGPIDFQVREPASPLFAHMRETATAMELQVTQEYMGQQCHLVYLPPLWKTVLDFDLRVDDEPTVIGRDILSGRRFNKTLTGFAGVVNVGHNATWLGTHMAMSNLYAFGRLAWDATQDAEAILGDWTRLTFGGDRRVLDTITQMSMDSWPAYENYTGNLGEQTLCDITYNHYGPNPQSMDNNPWGQWTRADATSIGMDRTVSNGTGYSGQYPPAVAARFEDITTTPEDLLLWFHHLPYDHVLASGDTILQHFYDAHYAGAETAASFPSRWKSLRGLLDEQRYAEMLFRLEYQAGHAIVWRDSITQFYHNISGGVPDARGRVGHHPFRLEAEDFAQRAGYKATGTNPFEVASGGLVLQTVDNSTAAHVQTPVPYPDGVYDVAVAYFDLYGGKAKYEARLAGRLLGSWTGDLEDRLGYTLTRGVDGHSATRVTFRGVRVRKGDVLRIDATPDGLEPAPLDYVAFLPPGVVD